jgi:hypothetical protein
MFFEAWSCQYRGINVGDYICDDSWIPEAPKMMQPPVVESTGKPDVWLKTSLPFEGAPKGSVKYDPFVTMYSRSAQDVYNLK